jgi:uncharacterized membrane protein YphA (DoxX/SURF4 family)
MNIVLWVLQILLAAVFFAHGWTFLFPPPEVIAMLNASISPAFRILLGAAEVAAAFGLIVPGITRILPWLISIAAGALVMVMIAATVLHLQRNEPSSAMVTAGLFAVATFVAYMRWKVNPIAARRLA